MEDLLLVLINCLGSYFVLDICMLSLAEEKMDWKKMADLVVFAGIPSGIVYYLLNFAVDINIYIAYVLGSLTVLVSGTVVAAWIWKYDYWKSLTIVCLSGMMQVSFTALSESIGMIYLKQRIENAVVRMVCILIACILMAVGTTWMLRRIHFNRTVRYLLEDEKNKRRITIQIVAMEWMTELLYMFGTYIVSSEGVAAMYDVTIIILLFLLIGIVVYLSKKEEYVHKRQLQQSMILQQQMYVEHLEQMQREMRVFRHDYKNMLSGMYVYAKEGETEKIQDVLEKLEIDFDYKIGEKIHTATQIGNIHIPEVKSLVLSKLTKMNKEGIDCSIEVLYPFAGIQMDVLDFNRCLGILIDNAMEAAAELEHPNVELLLMCHDRFLTVRVANSCKEDPDIAHMWKEGYSTKGNHRGLGLASYQQILARYPDVEPYTSYENSLFVQEFTVAVC